MIFGLTDDGVARDGAEVGRLLKQVTGRDGTLLKEPALRTCRQGTQTRAHTVYHSVLATCSEQVRHHRGKRSCGISVEIRLSLEAAESPGERAGSADLGAARRGQSQAYLLPEERLLPQPQWRTLRK